MKKALSLHSHTHNSNMKKALTSTKITRPLWMSYKDYMPWPNEHCTVGTTYDAMMDRENKPDRAFVSRHVSNDDDSNA
jgi:hypothetical protein